VSERTERLPPWLLSVLIGLVWFVVATWITIAEHQTYNSTSRDIGVYLQVLWNTGHGRPYQTTLLEANRVHLAEHVAPLLALISPAYAWAPDPRWLFVVQQAGLALSAVPIYLFARRRLGGTWLPTLVIAAFFAMPTLDEIAFDAFYPVTFTALPLAFAGYLLFSGRWRAGVACALLAPLIEEEAAVTVIGLGIVVLLVLRGARRWSVPLLVVGTLWLAALAFTFMPAFHEPSTLPSSADSRTVGHFDHLRRNPTEVLGDLLTNRVPLAARWLLAPTGGVALLAPEILLIDAPHAATLLLADNEGRYRRHWASPMLPFIWLAVVAGLARLRRPPLRLAGIAALVVGSVASYAVDSSLPGGDDYEAEDVVWTERAEQLDHLVATVPPGVSVSASRRALGHLADRSELYVYPPSYQGKLWPPERRIAVHVLDLTNDQTWDRLGGRESPLRASRPYAIWLAGSDALLLTDTPPMPDVLLEAELAGVRLDGYELQWDGEAIDLAARWSAPDRIGRRLTREVRLVDVAGAVVAEQRGSVLDELLPTDDWPVGQVVLDRVRLVPWSGVPTHAQVGWRSPDGAFEGIDIAVDPVSEAGQQ
jgi:uncharacterized membrane protein